MEEGWWGRGGEEGLRGGVEEWLRGGGVEGRREKWSRSMDVAQNLSYCICHLNRI